MEDFTPSNVVRSRSFEGRYICKTDSLQPFGINFEDTVRVSTAYPPLIVAKWKMLRENTLKCLLVTELWEAGKRVHWQGVQVPFSPVGEQQWVQTEVPVSLSVPLKSRNLLKIYLWRTEGPGRCWTDEVSITATP